MLNGCHKFQVTKFVVVASWPQFRKIVCFDGEATKVIMELFGAWMVKTKGFHITKLFFQFRRWSWIVCANMLALFISDTLKKLYAGSHKNGWKVKAINARWRCSTPGNLNALLSAHVRLSGANKTDVFQLNSCVCSYMPWMQLCDDRKSLFVSMGAEMRSYQLPQQLRRCGRSTLKFQTKYLPLQGKDLYRFRFKGDLFIGGGW